MFEQIVILHTKSPPIGEFFNRGESHVSQFWLILPSMVLFQNVWLLIRFRRVNQVPQLCHVLTEILDEGLQAFDVIIEIGVLSCLSVLIYERLKTYCLVVNCTNICDKHLQKLHVQKIFTEA